MHEKNDKEYVECLKRGDSVAFDVLFYKYSRGLYAFAYSITRNSFASEEITQLVFMKVWEKRNDLNEYYSFKSFLFSITYNETISWLRKDKSERRKINEFVQNSSFSTNETEKMVEFRNIEGIADKLINEMPAKRREVFKLSRNQGYSNKEIAQILGISIKTVENQMSSALKFLREKLHNGNIDGLLLYFMIYHV